MTQKRENRYGIKSLEKDFTTDIKRSITGTHKVVSRKYLQEYLNAFVFHRNNRYSDKERFWLLLGILITPLTA